MADNIYLTQEGYDKIKAELDDLKTRGRREAADAIAEAREKGDLSENAEYDAAKDAQGILEMKINDLEKKIAHARIVDASQIDTDKVNILTTVKLKNIKINKSIEYTLVGESEADLKAKKISVNSPIGKGLLGKKVGEVAEIKTPGGVIQFEVLEISIK
ncbi:transcription elongation factor GreA [Membranihabitans maritimus]|uniref:transcription elongation factor GreA n=1 Tax=Membranihabitans maritimus TaxID=2904244 RepID=UPI001F00753C|nr:transcription elongation factor GreA [Membranihabitans maritimus]